jgi:hypothetical protein
MSPKYARIPCVQVLRSLLQDIPVKRTKRVNSRRSTLVAKCMVAECVAKRIRAEGVVTTRSRSSSQKAILAAVHKLDNTSVYVLELMGGLIYVGQSSNVERRIEQHMNGRGAMFTRRHKPTGIRLPRLGNVNGAGDSGERQEVLLQMRMHGMHAVRGWRYCNNTLSALDVSDIKSNWVEMFNLCRRCMGQGHMASGCTIYSKRRSTT